MGRKFECAARVERVLLRKAIPVQERLCDYRRCGISATSLACRVIGFVRITEFHQAFNQPVRADKSCFSELLPAPGNSSPVWPFTEADLLP